METPTRTLFCILVLGAIVIFSGCTYQPETNETGDVSYISEDVENASLTEDTQGKDTSETVEKSSGDKDKTEKDEKPASTPNKITVYEGELVELKVKGTDPDGDKVTYSFSQPLNDNGKWQTEEGDAGEYLVTVTASDGKTQTSKTLKIEVLSRNNPPKMDPIEDIRVKEGETISLSPNVVDPDGDEVTVEYSGWMTSATKKTGYDDAGEHTVTVTASDGETQVQQKVNIEVTDVNRAPEFEIIVS